MDNLFFNPENYIKLDIKMSHSEFVDETTNRVSNSQTIIIFSFMIFFFLQIIGMKSLSSMLYLICEILILLNLS